MKHNYDDLIKSFKSMFSKNLGDDLSIPYKQFHKDGIMNFILHKEKENNDFNSLVLICDSATVCEDEDAGLYFTEKALLEISPDTALFIGAALIGFVLSKDNAE